MSRNSELVRQWEILRNIDGGRSGITVPKLGAMRHVHQRTIRRDIDALCVLLRMHLCVDRPLLRWILGFGPSARVVYPDDLAQARTSRRRSRTLRRAPAVHDGTDVD